MTYFQVEQGSDTSGSGDPADDKAIKLILIGAVIFGLSGVINVALFLLTRPKLLSLNQVRRPKSLFTAVITVQQSRTVYPDPPELEDSKSSSPTRSQSNGTDYLPKLTSNEATWIDLTPVQQTPSRDALGRLIIKHGEAL